MSDESLGLTRYQMEAELRWMLRNVPADPRALADTLANAFITLIEKNNAAIAESMQQGDDLDGEEY